MSIAHKNPHDAGQHAPPLLRPVSAPLTYQAPANESKATRLFRSLFHPKSPVFWILLLACVSIATWQFRQYRANYDRKAFEKVAYGTAGLPSEVFFTGQPTPASLRYFIASYPKKTHLCFAWGVYTEPDTFKHFRGQPLTNIDRLSFCSDMYVDSWLKEITRPDTSMTGLNWLDLSKSYVSDAGISELCKSDSGLKNLSVLELNETRITDASLSAIADSDNQLKFLRGLDLNATKVTDDGLIKLGRSKNAMQTVIFLCLQSTKITDVGLCDFFKHKAGVEKIRVLLLAGTKITDDGLATIIRSGKLDSLAMLDIRNTAITGQTLELMSNNYLMPSLVELHLNGFRLSAKSIQLLQDSKPNLKICKY